MTYPVEAHRDKLLQASKNHKTKR